MNIVKQSYEILYPDIHKKEIADEMIKRIEAAGRTCYKSEDKITSTSASKFVDKIITLGHHSVLEHESIQVRLITDRGVTHELVRHRLASYSQESTRYCDYGSDDVTFILPVWFDEIDTSSYMEWERAMSECENIYKDLRFLGWTPQQARSVLPNSLKTEIVITANIREWRHIFNLRCAPSAHPQMIGLMMPVLEDFSKHLPILFSDILEGR